MDEMVNHPVGHAERTHIPISKVRAFVVTALGRDVLDDEEFFTTGMVSSLFAMQLIAFVERSFAIEVADEDLSMDNFKSIADISRFVRRKRACR